MPNGPILAVSIALFRGSDVLLVKRANAPAKGLYAFPGGSVDHGETLEEAVRRELREETGLVPRSLKFHRLVELIGNGGDAETGDHHYVLAVFTGTSDEGTATPGDDAAEAAFFGPDEVERVQTTESTRQVIAELHALTGK